MESKGQSEQGRLEIDEQKWIEENSEARQEQTSSKEETNASKPKNKAARKSFANGLSVGVGIGSIVTFVIMWVTIFFTPQLPKEATYESMLSMFMFPLIYLLAVGLITLTTGIVREYYPNTPET